MNPLKNFLKENDIPIETARSLFEKLLSLKEQESCVISEQNKPLVDFLNKDFDSLLFQLEGILGDADFEIADGEVFVLEPRVDSYETSVLSKTNLTKAYQNAYELIYPDSLSKFFQMNPHGTIWECHSGKCEGRHNKIADLDSPEKVSFYQSKILEKGFCRCPKRSCKNTFKFSEQGEIIFETLEESVDN